MAPRVILVGPMGSGKSTIGALIAQRLQLPFRDTDTVIEEESGRSVSDIFCEDGEEAFRA
jgi:shikimate kinase